MGSSSQHKPKPGHAKSGNLSTSITWDPNYRNIDKAAHEELGRPAAEIVRDTQSGLLRMKAYDTGTLYRSYRSVDRGPTRGFDVGTNVEYAPFIEFGTYKMQARPAFQQAINKASRKYKTLRMPGLSR